MAEPKTYLSTNGGMWRVIHDGLPICADTPIRDVRKPRRGK